VDSGTPSRRGLWPAFTRCHRCSSPLREHAYADLAVASAGSAAETAITGVIEDEAWERLSSLRLSVITEGEGTITFRALRCPSGGGAVVLLALAATVLEDDRLAGTVYQVSEEDLNLISQSSRLRWRPYEDSWSGRPAGE